MNYLNKLLLVTLIAGFIISCSKSSTGTGPDPEEPGTKEETGKKNTGTLEVIITTDGPMQDEDGYELNLDGGSEKPTETEGTITFADLEEGSYSLGIGGIAKNCSIDGENPVEVTITAEQTNTIDVQIVCKLALRDKIIFASDREDRDNSMGIYTMNTDGSDQKKFMDSSNSVLLPAVSPDGTQVVYATIGQSHVNYSLVNADGTGNTALTSGNEGVTSFWGTSSWSPDGSRIAFISDRDGDGDIYVMNTDGSEQVNITQSDSSETMSHSAWSPDGTKIIYSSKRGPGDDYEIYLNNASGGGLKQLTDNEYDEQLPAWSPDGSRIAFSSDSKGDGVFNIYVMNADGSGLKQLTDEDTEDIFPAWSPDGTRIAYMRGQGMTSEIYVINADGSGSALNLTGSSAVEGYHHWSPANPL